MAAPVHRDAAREEVVNTLVLCAQGRGMCGERGTPVASGHHPADQRHDHALRGVPDGQPVGEELHHHVEAGPHPQLRGTGGPLVAPHPAELQRAVPYG